MTNDALPDNTRRITDDETIERACDWSDYRKHYGVSRDPVLLGREHQAFKAGWDAARIGTADKIMPKETR